MGVRWRLHQALSHELCVGLPLFRSLTNTSFFFLSFFQQSLQQVWGDTSSWFWFASPWRWVMLGIFYVSFNPLYVFFERNVHSSSLSIFKLGYLVFHYWVVWVPYIYWVLSPYQMCGLQMFSPIFWCYKNLVPHNYPLSQLSFWSSANYCLTVIYFMYF